MRLRVELTEGPDLASGRGVATGVVKVDVYARRTPRSPEGVADPAGEHRRANGVVAHLAELNRRLAFQIQGGLSSRGTPEAQAGRVPQLASDGPVPADGTGVALLADPVDLGPHCDSSRLQRAIYAEQRGRRVTPVGLIETHHDRPCPERRDAATPVAVTCGHAVEATFRVGPIERAHEALASVRHLQPAAAEREGAALPATRRRHHLGVQLVHVHFIHVRGPSAAERKRTDNQHVAQVAARVAITYELRHTAMWREDSACARRQRNVILPYRSDRRSET